MPFLLIGFLTLILGVYLLRELGRASPARVAVYVRNGGGFFAAAAALLLLLRGRLSLAIGLGGLSLYLFTGDRIAWRKIFERRPPGRRASQIRTAFLDMTLDHASGEVDGTVLSGAFAGMRLNAMTRDEILRLREDCAALDPDSVLVLDNYLDRRFPGGGAAGERDAHAGRQGSGQQGQWRSRGGEMSEQEAYQTLGLRPGASAEEIVRAHRRLMKERHPDHGGTTDDAARINQAKDRLIRRHD
ncbi:DnaJ domain-containing protein [Rhodoblastus sp.]|uniref:DnaJ domain-containing protein n=1 Tax=Rhodoblastus sp. TaxID=1962975 RepID=UPI003F9B5B52